MQRPRRQHYEFAHLALPRLSAENPKRFIAMLHQHEEAFLRYYWDRCGEGLTPPERALMRGIDWNIGKLDPDHVLVSIRMPAPEHVSEAHYVAVVHNERGPAQKRRCFVLEQSFDIGATVLAEWTEVGRLNLGPGPEPTEEALVHRLQLLLRIGPGATQAMSA